MLIRHLALTVRDPPASADFYLSVIGLDGEARLEPWGCRLVLRDGFMLALIRGEPLASRLARHRALRLRTPLPEDARLVRDRLRAAARVKSTGRTTAGYVGVKVEDPDGYVVELSYDAT